MKIQVTDEDIAKGMRRSASECPIALSIKPLKMKSGALLSECERYRFCLWRNWDDTLPILYWIMLNPSIADSNIDDPTIRKCMGFARVLGYGGIYVYNLFALRATDPKELRKVTLTEAIGDNDLCPDSFGTNATIIAAWGNGGKLGGRSTEIRNKFKLAGVPLYALKVSKTGEPWHPLYLKYDLKPFLMWMEGD